MFMTTSKDRHIEVLGKERRRRWSVEEKLAMVREGLEPGQSVLVVARRNGINPNQLFHWRKLYQDDSLSAVSAGEAVVPAKVAIRKPGLRSRSLPPKCQASNRARA